MPAIIRTFLPEDSTRTVVIDHLLGIVIRQMTTARNPTIGANWKAQQNQIKK